MSNAALYLITVAIWGSTWFAIEFQLGAVAPEVSVFYRYALAAALLFGWCAARGLRMRFGLREHMSFALLGMLLFCLNYVLAYHAQRYITSALVAIAFSTMLWMNIVNARWFFGTRSSVRALLGALLGVAGVVVMFLPSIRDTAAGVATLTGALLSMLGAYIASLGNMVSQRAQSRGLPVIQSNAWGMAYGAAFTGAIALAQGQAFTFDPRPGYVLSLLFLVVFGSIIAFGAYLTLVGRIGAHRAGYAVVLFPLVAFVLSMLFEGLVLTAPLVIGAVLVLIGNWLVMGRAAERVRFSSTRKRAEHTSPAELQTEQGG